MIQFKMAEALGKKELQGGTFACNKSGNGEGFGKKSCREEEEFQGNLGIGAPSFFSVW
jgi:hypothetical protein